MEDHCAQALLVWERFSHKEVNAGLVMWRVGSLCTGNRMGTVQSNTKKLMLGWWCGRPLCIARLGTV